MYTKDLNFVGLMYLIPSCIATIENREGTLRLSLERFEEIPLSVKSSNPFTLFSFFKPQKKGAPPLQNLVVGFFLG